MFIKPASICLNFNYKNKTGDNFVFEPFVMFETLLWSFSHRQVSVNVSFFTEEFSGTCLVQNKATSQRWSWFPWQQRSETFLWGTALNTVPKGQFLTTDINSRAVNQLVTRAPSPGEDAILHLNFWNPYTTSQTRNFCQKKQLFVELWATAAFPLDLEHLFPQTEMEHTSEELWGVCRCMNRRASGEQRGFSADDTEQLCDLWPNCDWPQYLQN